MNIRKTTVVIATALLAGLGIIPAANAQPTPTPLPVPGISFTADPPSPVAPGTKVLLHTKVDPEGIAEIRSTVRL